MDNRTATAHAPHTHHQRSRTELPDGTRPHNNEAPNRAQHRPGPSAGITEHAHYGDNDVMYE
ncbi:MAG: hypothetical protein ACOYOQ_14870 [Microthrixaceae bacterium]